MDDRIQAIAADAALDVLHRFKQDHLGWTDDRTPVDEVVSWLGLEIATFHPNDYAEGTYGWLEPEEDLIWLRRDLPETLRRFTLAHELGHVILHRNAGHSASIALPIPNTEISQSTEQLGIEPTFEDPCQAPDVREEVTGLIDSERAEELLGIGQSYNPRSQRELAANIFASELLMPLERVRTLYLQEHVSPRKFASIFDVSNAAMLNRLAGLLEEPNSSIGKWLQERASEVGEGRHPQGAPPPYPAAPASTYKEKSFKTPPHIRESLPTGGDHKGPPHPSLPPSPLQTIETVSK